MSSEHVYDERSIQVLSGLEAVRRRPGMYVGNPADGTGLIHLVLAVVEDAIIGECDRLILQIEDDRTLRIEVEGASFPVEAHPREEVSVFEVLMTTLFAGAGRYLEANAGHWRDVNAYKQCLGFHGVGLAVVNALCERLEAHIWRDGHHWRQRFERGEPVEPLERLEEAPGHRYWMRLMTDDTIFTSPRLDFDALRMRLEDMALSHPGLQIMVHDARDRRGLELCYPQGVASMLAVARPPGCPILTVQERLDVGQDLPAMLDLALAITPGAGWQRAVLCGQTCRFGSHIDGVRRALEQAIDVGEGDLMRGFEEDISLVMSLWMERPRYGGPTRERMQHDDADEAVAAALQPVLARWFARRPEVRRAAVAMRGGGASVE